MLKLAYDFSARAIRTLRHVPIADIETRTACEWQNEDLSTGLASFVPTNDLEHLRDDVVERAGRFKHSRGRDFKVHLEGVAAVLMRWNCAPLVVQTGLFHSAYSTQQYPYGIYDHTQREQLISVLGTDGERLVFVFCTHDRVDLYAQVVELARAGQPLPAEGLRLRNALTGSHALVPCELLTILLQVHAADLVEQLNGFDFEMIYALLAVIENRVDVPACLHEMRAGGVGPSTLGIELPTRMGTLALAPLLGINRRLLPMRIAISRWLSRNRTLTDAELARLQGFEAEFPYVLELPWLRLMHEEGLTAEQQNRLRARCVALYRAWGTPWLKAPFEHNRVFERWLLSETAPPALGLAADQLVSA